jgi:hypothetical protein
MVMTLQSEDWRLGASERELEEQKRRGRAVASGKEESKLRENFEVLRAGRRRHSATA